MITLEQWEELVKNDMPIVFAVVSQNVDCCGYPTKEEALIAFVEEQKGKKYGDNFLPPEGYTNGKERKIMERLEALEKKVAELEEWRIRHLMIFHDKPLTEEQQKKADKLFLEQMNK